MNRDIYLAQFHKTKWYCHIREQKTQIRELKAENLRLHQKNRVLEYLAYASNFSWGKARN